jgi:hypothetical protein
VNCAAKAWSRWPVRFASWKRRRARGKVNTVRCEAVNAMLLNEFLKEHRKVQELQKQIEALTTGLQKVNDQLELTKTAPQLVANDQ